MIWTAQYCIGGYFFVWDLEEFSGFWELLMASESFQRLSEAFSGFKKQRKYFHAQLTHQFGWPFLWEVFFHCLISTAPFFYVYTNVNHPALIAPFSCKMFPLADDSFVLHEYKCIECLNTLLYAAISLLISTNLWLKKFLANRLKILNTVGEF